MHSRRSFLKNSAFAGTGLLLGSAALSACASRMAGASTSSMPFGLQLYSLRDDLPKDPKGVLKQVAGFGYKQLEGYEGPQGLFWGMSNTDFKKYVSDLGMDFVSSHCAWEKDLDTKAAQAAEIGMKYLLCPYLGPQPTIEDFKKYAAKFNEAGAICKKHGIRFGYHNHAYSFKPVDGQLPQKVMMDETDPELVDFEMDMYWVVDAGESPEKWLRDYKGRFKLCHVKDRMKNADPAAPNNSCTLGTGTIDFPSILKVAKENGMQYYIVEQERYDGTTPLESAADNAAYMKKISV